jgi:hypothetical protein
MQAFAASFRPFLTATTVTMSMHGKLMLQCEVSSVIMQRVRVIRHLKVQITPDETELLYMSQSISGFLWSPEKDSPQMDSNPLLRD